MCPYMTYLPGIQWLCVLTADQYVSLKKLYYTGKPWAQLVRGLKASFPKQANFAPVPHVVTQ